jgi:hypothetical protein
VLDRQRHGVTNSGYVGIDLGAAQSMPTSTMESTWCLNSRTRHPALVRRIRVDQPTKKHPNIDEDATTIAAWINTAGLKRAFRVPIPRAIP